MGDGRQSRISRASNRNESSIVVTTRTSGSHRNRSPRTKQRKTSNKQLDQQRQEDEEEAQTQEIEPDRLSDLPDSLLLHILSLSLALLQSGHTHRYPLSKRWLNLWTFVPNFLFTHVNTDIVSSNHACVKFVSDVNRTLSQSCVSKVDKFSILRPYCSRFESHVDSWLHFVTKNNVHHLTLAFVDMIDRKDFFLGK